MIRKVLLFMLMFAALFAAQTAQASSQGQTRQLAAVQMQVRGLQMQIGKSQSVVNFYHHRGKWALHTPGTTHGKKHCYEVVGTARQKACRHARRTLTAYAGQLRQLQQEMVNSVARYAVASITANYKTAGSEFLSEVPGMVKASYEQGVSPFLVFGIAATESGLGRQTCGKNAWGWGSCSTNGWHSFTEGAQSVAYSLRTKYMGGWGTDTVSEVAYYYNRGNWNNWAGKVQYFMSSIFGANGGLRWDDAVQSLVAV